MFWNISNRGMLPARPEVFIDHHGADAFGKIRMAHSLPGQNQLPLHHFSETHLRTAPELLHDQPGGGRAPATEMINALPQPGVLSAHSDV